MCDLLTMVKCRICLLPKFAVTLKTTLMETQYWRKVYKATTETYFEDFYTQMIISWSWRCSGYLKNL